MINIDIIFDSILKSRVDVIVHPLYAVTSTDSLFKRIKTIYPDHYINYIKRCDVFKKSPLNLLGTILMTELEYDRFVCGIYCKIKKYTHSNSVYDDFERCLKELRDEIHSMVDSRERLYTIGIPYHILCNKEDDWVTVYSIIYKIFNDEPNINVIIYKE